MHDLVAGESPWDHTGDLSTESEHRVRQETHQADTPAPMDQSGSTLGQALAQLASNSTENGVETRAGPPGDADVHE